MKIPIYKYGGRDVIKVGGERRQDLVMILDLNLRIGHSGDDFINLLKKDICGIGLYSYDELNYILKQNGYDLNKYNNKFYYTKLSTKPHAYLFSSNTYYKLSNL